MRLPYFPDPPPNTTPPSTLSTIASIRARRHPSPLLSLDRTLLHSTPLASGWNAFLGAIRTQTTSLPADIRELLICRVAALNRAAYEWEHHAPLLREALVAKGWEKGVVDGVLGVVKVGEGGFGAGLEGCFGGEEEREWVGKAKAVVAYADAMTRDVVVREEVWEEMRRWVGSEREVVEVTGVVAAYNCVSRFLVALEVGERVWVD